MTPRNWVIRIADDAGADRERVAEAITTALEGLGYRVLSVRPPMELNPQPLRVRKDR